jgi:hypothetical protein
MIVIEEKLISEDILDEAFVCNLNACKGACCVEGDEGAFLEASELAELERVYPVVKEYITDAGRLAVERQGYHITNSDGELKTPLINNGPCAYVYYSEGTALCGIEKAYRDGKIDWMKPVSCHLYPIRITRVGDFDALNYERWDICSPACTYGESLQVPVYRFVKDALIRKYGEGFYEALDATYNYRKEQA